MASRQTPKYTASTNPKKSLPATFKVSRCSLMQMEGIERELFKVLEDVMSGNIVITDLDPAKVSEYDFSSFTFALAQILYNQSYQYGNEDINSGIERKVEVKEVWKRSNAHGGVIDTTLNDICRLAYGREADKKDRKKMATIIKSIDGREATFMTSNNDILKSKLFVVLDEYRREGKGEVSYRLYLNPIFGSEIKNQFGVLTQDVMRRIDQACKEKKKRQSYELIVLLKWLSHQDKKKTRTIRNLAEMLGMEEYFKCNRARAEEKILSLCEIMAYIGILENYDVEYSFGSRKTIEKITFHKGKNYLRISKTP